MKFKKWLINESTYLDVGHDSEGNFDSFILKRNAQDIELASTLGVDPEFFHDDENPAVKRSDYKGRIDHDKKRISIVSILSADEERLKYLVDVLKMDFQGYGIHFFSYGRPRKLA